MLKFGMATPMMLRYKELKEEAKEHILFFRLGDFYEMFYEDAELVSRELGLTKTSRGTEVNEDGEEQKIPMCGVPHHAANMYIRRLIDRGYSVALAEQLTQPQKGKQMVERGIVKIITPGTILDEDFLDQKQSNYVSAVYYPQKGERGSVSWADISTGEFHAVEVFDQNAYLDIISAIAPKEIIMTSEFKKIAKARLGIRMSDHYDYAFNPLTAHEMILKYFAIKSTKVFDFEMQSPITPSAGALLEFLFQTQKIHMENIRGIKLIKPAEYMFLDKVARDHLELVKNLREQRKEGSLIWVLDDTKTAMGARLLSQIVSNPLQDSARINQRLDAVEALLPGRTRQTLRAQLGKMSDLSRLSGKIGSRSVNPRDLIALRTSLGQLGEIKATLLEFGKGLLKNVQEGMQPIPQLCELISRAIAEEPPSKLDEGGYIRDGYNRELDELRDAGRQGHVWLAKLEESERAETKMKELKIGFNRVTGYYFDVPKKYASDIPFRFNRIATTTNSERFINEDLKKMERKILGAEEKAKELESRLLSLIRDEVATYVGQIQENAQQLAILDVLCTLAEIARTYNWIRPSFNLDGRIEFKGARHPVVERIIGTSRYIANDCDLGKNDKSTMILTGPNMAGKSTYMRSVALCVVLAHIGSFVPATFADVSIVDRIFTRIGASDSLLSGESTFMVEMNEVATILNNATSKSLVLLDEVGRGTSTSDGLALASSIISYITNNIGANTMFATHFHELTSLVNPKIANYKMLTEQFDDRIVFLHKVEPGIEQNSFGIDVAKLAGLPEEVVEGARKLLKS